MNVLNLIIMFSAPTGTMQPSIILISVGTTNELNLRYSRRKTSTVDGASGLALISSSVVSRP